MPKLNKRRHHSAECSRKSAEKRRSDTKSGLTQEVEALDVQEKPDLPDLGSHINDGMNFFQNFSSLRKLLAGLVCCLCHSPVSLELCSIYILKTSLELKCGNKSCAKYAKPTIHKTVTKHFDSAFITALEANGITDTQMTDQLGLMNFSGTNKTGVLYSTYAETEPRRKLKRKIRRKIVDVASAEQQEQLAKICESQNPVISSVDAGFAIRDFKSPVAWVSHIVNKKCVETVVVKKPPTIKAGDNPQPQVASEVFCDQKPQYYESTGIDQMLKYGKFKKLPVYTSCKEINK